MFANLKLYAAIGATALLLGTSVYAWIEHGEVVSQKTTIDKVNDCYSALGGKGDVSTACNAAVVVYFNRAQNAGTCDQALNQDATAPECSKAVDDLFANYATVKATLQSTVADRDAAIARASNRATDEAQQKAQDAQVLAKAPRQPDGLILCDADCLRQRFEDGTDASASAAGDH